MYRYTTPTLPITIEDIDFSLVNNFRIAIEQKGKEDKLFIVIEIQKTGEQVATLVNSYADYKDAISKYHTVLAYAAKSGLDRHSAVILDEYGKEIVSESY